ncbi:glycosyltransferase [Viridibacterium curvum]|uniref:Streptomycin biosynthesis protein StrF domain-containing protein n=1 Tax=Viridibacterium curvum TaxID=1101404 RepID=A0ABP9R1H6_9RHOO
MKPYKTWSVIVCSIDAGKYAHIVQSYERLLATRSFEIIGIHDAASLAEAYNRGIARARGEIIVFSHDDILILDDAFADKVESRLGQDFDLLGFAGATAIRDGYWWSAGPAHMRGAVSHAPPGKPQLSLHIYGVTRAEAEPVQVLDGLCLIASREATERQQFDAATFDGFHLYDLDFSLSAQRQGLRVGVLTDVPIIHMSAGSFGNEWRRYRNLFARKHAEYLGLQTDVALPEPDRLRARVALFDDATSLRAFWTCENLLRATLAEQRQGI